MRSIRLIQPLELSRLGPWVGDGPVHLRQGDADGVCGPYCVLMALMAYGLVGWEKVVEPDVKDRRTRLGRVWSKFGTLGPLACRGSDDDDLEDILGEFGPSIAVHHPKQHSPKALSKFIVGELELDRPVIAGIETDSGLRHWVLAVGLDQGEAGMNLLVLDPSCEVSSVTAWNAVIELSGNRIKYPSEYWSQSHSEYCVIETAMSIARQ